MCTRCAPDTTARRARSATTVTSNDGDGSDDDRGGGGGGDGGGGGGDVGCSSSDGTTDTPRLSSAILVCRLGAAIAIAVAVIVVIDIIIIVVLVICTNTLQRTITLYTFSLRIDRTPRNIRFARDICLEVSPHDVSLAFGNLYCFLDCVSIIGC